VKQKFTKVVLGEHLLHKKLEFILSNTSLYQEVAVAELEPLVLEHSQAEAVVQVVVL
jgi:hypothetical protein